MKDEKSRGAGRSGSGPSKSGAESAEERRDRFGRFLENLPVKSLKRRARHTTPHVAFFEECHDLMVRIVGEGASYGRMVAILREFDAELFAKLSVNALRSWLQSDPECSALIEKQKSNGDRPSYGGRPKGVVRSDTQVIAPAAASVAPVDSAATVAPTPVDALTPAAFDPAVAMRDPRIIPEPGGGRVIRVDADGESVLMVLDDILAPRDPSKVLIYGGQFVLDVAADRYSVKPSVAFGPSWGPMADLGDRAVGYWDAKRGPAERAALVKELESTGLPEHYVLASTVAAYAKDPGRRERAVANLARYAVGLVPPAAMLLGGPKADL